MLAKPAPRPSQHAPVRVGLARVATTLIALALCGSVAVEPGRAAPGDSSPDGYFGPAPQVSYPGMPTSYFPGPPTAPPQTTRPAGWPGGAPADRPGSPRPTTADGVSSGPPPLAMAMQPCASSQIFARVGSDVILAADVIPKVDELVMARVKDVPREQLKQISPQQIDALRVAFAGKLLDEYVKIKLVYLDARTVIPQEHFPEVEKKVGDLFDKDEVPKIMKRLKAASRPEMEEKLRANGTTLDRERQAFLEMVLAKQWQQEKVKISKEISEEETVSYYRDHHAEFEHPARARWEELMTGFTSYSSRTAAYNALSQMGNAVLNGASFAEVAKSHSDGPTASKGGLHDWTNQGSLVSKEMDQALFGLRIGAMSQIIEDKAGLHILRVIERKDVSRTPFTEAQVAIRSKIKDQRTRKETAAYIEKLREQTPIWIASDLSVGLTPLVLDRGSAPKPAAGGPLEEARRN